MIVSVFPSAFSILSLVFEQALEAQAVLGGGKVGNSFFHRRGIVAKRVQARAMGDDSDFDLHPLSGGSADKCFRRCLARNSAVRDR